MENRQASLTASDLQEYPIILMSLQDTMSKDNYSRLAAIEGKSHPEFTRQSGKEVHPEYIRQIPETLSQKTLTRNVKPDKTFLIIS
ncbi:MAG: hypothetical protein V8R91_16550 [Butyricimonas faecihominis]